MEGGCFTWTGRATYKYNTIRFCDYAYKVIIITFWKTHFFKGNRLTGGQNTHDDILQTSLGWNRCNPEFNVLAPVFFKFDLAVLGLAAFCNIEVGHDFDTWYDCILIAERYGLVYRTGTVYSYPDIGGLLSGVRFDMYIRCVTGVGIKNNFINELDNSAVLFTYCAFGFFYLIRFVLQLWKDIINSCHFFFILGKEFNKIKNILF